MLVCEEEEQLWKWRKRQHWCEEREEREELHSMKVDERGSELVLPWQWRLRSLELRQMKL